MENNDESDIPLSLIEMEETPTELSEGRVPQPNEDQKKKPTIPLGYGNEMLQNGFNISDISCFNKAYKRLEDVIYMKLHCTICDKHLGSAPNAISKRMEHPLLKVLICKSCFVFYSTAKFSKRKNGSKLHCRWCGQGESMTCCTKCNFVFCKKCVARNSERGKLAVIERCSAWICFACNPCQIATHRATYYAIQKYSILMLQKYQDKPNDPKLSTDSNVCCKGSPEHHKYEPRLKKPKMHASTMLLQSPLDQKQNEDIQDNLESEPDVICIDEIDPLPEFLNLQVLHPRQVLQPIPKENRPKIASSPTTTMGSRTPAQANLILTESQVLSQATSRANKKDNFKETSNLPVNPTNIKEPNQKYDWYNFAITNIVETIEFVSSKIVSLSSLHEKTRRCAPSMKKLHNIFNIYLDIYINNLKNIKLATKKQFDSELAELKKNPPTRKRNRPSKKIRSQNRKLFDEASRAIFQLRADQKITNSSSSINDTAELNTNVITGSKNDTNNITDSSIKERKNLSECIEPKVSTNMLAKEWIKISDEVSNTRFVLRSGRTITNSQSATKQGAELEKNVLIGEGSKNDAKNIAATKCIEPNVNVNILEEEFIKYSSAVVQIKNDDVDQKRFDNIKKQNFQTQIYQNEKNKKSKTTKIKGRKIAKAEKSKTKTLKQNPKVKDKPSPKTEVISSPKIDTVNSSKKEDVQDLPTSKNVTQNEVTPNWVEVTPSLEKDVSLKQDSSIPMEEEPPILEDEKIENPYDVEDVQDLSTSKNVTQNEVTPNWVEITQSLEKDVFLRQDAWIPMEEEPPIWEDEKIENPYDVEDVQDLSTSKNVTQNEVTPNWVEITQSLEKGVSLRQDSWIPMEEEPPIWEDEKIENPYDVEDVQDLSTSKNVTQNEVTPNWVEITQSLEKDVSLRQDSWIPMEEEPPIWEDEKIENPYDVEDVLDLPTSKNVTQKEVTPNWVEITPSLEKDVSLKQDSWIPIEVQQPILEDESSFDIEDFLLRNIITRPPTQIIPNTPEIDTLFLSDKESGAIDSIEKDLEDVEKLLSILNDDSSLSLPPFGMGLCPNHLFRDDDKEDAENISLIENSKENNDAKNANETMNSMENEILKAKD